MVENGSGTDTAARSTVLPTSSVGGGVGDKLNRRRLPTMTTVRGRWFTFVGEEIEQRWVMPEELCCRRGKERWKRGERSGEGTSNEGWFWVAFTEYEGGKTEARSVGVDR
ncbi:unnamed protein product [Lactuca virosa]|uniref:Uncharacterized protein n=1 Tax=Lactuca virosa TaxID=75947 RepID=A0AAU9LZC3_9ASTR|nr:unnamed protein product [Lactuca virosa]